MPETSSHHRQIGQRRWIFPTCTGLLILAAIGINPVLSAAKSHFAKTGILPRVPLAKFNTDVLSSFKAAPEESPFELPHTDDEAGSDDMLSLRVQERGASGMAGQAYLFVTYYTDPEGSVPHTPEVCYRLLGATIRSVTASVIDLPDTAGLPSRIEVRTIVAEESTSTAIISFVFCANAQFHTQRNEVRLAMGMPGPKRWYFSKIEVVAQAQKGEDPTPVVNRCLRLMTEALPELVGRHFPNSEDVKQRLVDDDHRVGP